MSRIRIVIAREVLDSRGRPTVEAEVHTVDGAVGTAIAPSGASTGRFEAKELRDGDRRRYGGAGVLTAVDNVHTRIAPVLRDVDPSDQAAVDRRMLSLDGSPDKGRIGANAMLAVSLAAARAGAAERGVSLYEHVADLAGLTPAGAKKPADVPLGPDADGRPELTPESLRRNDPHGRGGRDRPGTERALAKGGRGTLLGADGGPVDTTTADADTVVEGVAPVGPRPWTIPLPMVNILSGGLHAGGNLAMQDFLAVPVGARDVRHAVEMVADVWRATGDELAERGRRERLVADEGGYGPELPSDEDALRVLTAAIKRAGYRPGKDVAIALDVAASHFHKDGRYRITGRELDAAGMVDLLERWVAEYPVVSIEDGLAEDDWAGWSLLTKRLGGRVQLVGDDLFVTNPARVARGVREGVGNAVLVKMNQIGTLSETLHVLGQARKAGYAAVVSARSGETEDVAMVHLAVGTAAGQIKIGSITRSERLAKYNEMFRLSDRLGTQAGLPLRPTAGLPRPARPAGPVDVDGPLKFPVAPRKKQTRRHDPGQVVAVCLQLAASPDIETERRCFAIRLIHDVVGAGKGTEELLEYLQAIGRRADNPLVRDVASEVYRKLRRGGGSSIIF